MFLSPSVYGIQPESSCGDTRLSPYLGWHPGRGVLRLGPSKTRRSRVAAHISTDTLKKYPYWTEFCVWKICRGTKMASLI